MKPGKVTVIIQAHMASTRLPGKILKDLHGEPVLYRVIERVRHSKRIDNIVIATSLMDCDDAIIEACDKWGVKTFRGSNDDVLARFWGAAQEFPSDYYVRMTSDCPLIEPSILDRAIQFFFDNNYKYVSYSLDPDAHYNLADGMGIEVFTPDLLDEAYHNATLPYEREHVSPYMYYTNESKGLCPYDRDESAYRLSLDTPADYKLICTVYDALYQPGNRFTLDEVLAYLDANPDVYAINADIQQKKVR